MLNFNNLWIEKYRPHSIGELCLDADVKNLITGYAAQKEIPNLLLVGRPGIGKTSLARIIINDLLKCQYLYINASDENGIDTVRHKITNFAQTKSLDGGIKIIVLDEADGLTEVGQRALRNTMEEYAKFTRFILTANQLHRIIPALQSRCQSIQVESSLLDVVMRCMHILKQENININEEQKQQLVKHVKMTHPDVRRIISNLQRMCATGDFVINNNDDKQFATQLLQNILGKSNCNSIREFIINNEESFGNDYNALLKNLLNSTYESEVDESKKQMLMCIIAEHLYRCSFAMDQEINVFHCCLNLLNVI
jgi:DNA polymerase III delta prime subunit